MWAWIDGMWVRFFFERTQACFRGAWVYELRCKVKQNGKKQNSHICTTQKEEKKLLFPQVQILFVGENESI